MLIKFNNINYIFFETYRAVRNQNEAKEGGRNYI